MLSISIQLYVFEYLQSQQFHSYKKYPSPSTLISYCIGVSCKTRHSQEPQAMVNHFAWEKSHQRFYGSDYFRSALPDAGIKGRDK